MHPLVYEINTRCWLSSLSQASGRELTLADVPQAQFEFWRDLGFTHIWLMGVWRTGPRGRAHSLKLAEFRKSASCYTEEEIAGSPYAVAEYVISSSLGGDAALRVFRTKLFSYGLKLILDFIPNHLGHDHAWLDERPDLFVQSQVKQPETFEHITAAGRRHFAYGKDPYLGAWVDTVQLNYRNPATRHAMIGELQRVAQLCDGVRCDMAMLVLDDVFAKTWNDFPLGRGEVQSSGLPGHLTPSPLPKAERESSGEFWSDAIQAVRAAFPEFLFIAEVYWGLETRLLELGFDFTYDKRLYDDLIARNAAAVQKRLLEAPPQFVFGGVHFLENHDEPRVASLLTAAEHKPAALVIAGLPGMCLLHEGQLTGARQRLSVHLGRRRLEPEQSDIAEFYGKLLETIQDSAVRRGSAWLLRPREAWPGNPTAVNFVVVQWQSMPRSFDLVVANLAGHASQCFVDLAGDEIAHHTWQMKDLLRNEEFVRDGPELQERGLFLDVAAHGAQLFRFVGVEFTRP